MAQPQPTPDVVSVRTEGDVAILTVHGPLLASVAEPLLDAVHQALASTPRLVVDLGEAPGADSAGIGALIRALKLARDSGGELVLVRPQEAVRALLDQTGLDTVFHIFPDLAQALAAHRPPAS